MKDLPFVVGEGLMLGSEGLGQMIVLTLFLKMVHGLLVLLD